MAPREGSRKSSRASSSPSPRPTTTGPPPPENSPPAAHKEEKAQAIQRILQHLYPDPPIPLNHHDKFTLLVAVILSAQTTDGKVNEVTKELFRLAPDCHRLAELPYDQVLSIIRPLGLSPMKAKNIIGTARDIRDRFGGQVPSSYEELESLPGVGHKTASVLMHQAFGEAAFPVDTHVHRLAIRWGFCSPTHDAKKAEAALKAVFPQEEWGKIGLQMIYFGREYCQAKAHSPSLCPICCWVSKKKEGTGDDAGLGPPSFGGEEDSDKAVKEYLGKFVSPRKSSKGIILYSERMAESSSSSACVKLEASLEEAAETPSVLVEEGVAKKRRRKK